MSVIGETQLHDGFNALPDLYDVPVVDLVQAVNELLKEPTAPPLLPNLHRKLKSALKFGRQAANRPNERLSEDEIASLNLLVQDTHLYKLLNRRLVTERKTLRHCLPLVKLLVTALYKLPPVKGIVYRGVQADITSHYPLESEKTWFAFRCALA